MSDAPLDHAKLAAARLWAATRLPYLASAVFACSVRARSGAGTIAVDRNWELCVDPAVVDGLEVAELGRLLVHLTGHLLRDHAARSEALGVDAGAEQSWWNRCTDAEINDDLRADDCVPPVASDLPSDLGCADGGLAETYYASTDFAPDLVGANGQPGWDCGSGADGQQRPWDGNEGSAAMRPAQAELLRLGVAADIKRRHGEQPGTIAGGWLRWAEAVLPSRVDWRRVLAAEIRSAVSAVSGRVDYTYRRPARRNQATPGVVLPSLFQPVPQVAIVCDTSGSMHEELLARVLAEVDALLSRTGLRSSRVPVLAVDTEVHAVRRVTRASQVVLAGGGGTDMGAGIDAAVRLRPRPGLVIVLTDGMTPWPDRPPAGVRVVVGVLAERGLPSDWLPPSWARTVVVDDL